MPNNPLILTKKIHIAPQSQVLLDCCLWEFSDEYKLCAKIVILSDQLEERRSNSLTSSLGEIEEDSKAFVSGINLSKNTTTLNDLTETVHFEIMIESQANDFFETDPQLVSIAKMRNTVDLVDLGGELHQLVQDFQFQKN